MMYGQDEEEYGGQQPYGDLQRERSSVTRRLRRQPAEYESTPYYGEQMPSWRQSPEQKLFEQLRALLGGLLGEARGGTVELGQSPYQNRLPRPGLSPYGIQE